MLQVPSYCDIQLTLDIKCKVDKKKKGKKKLERMQNEVAIDKDRRIIDFFNLD